MPAGSWIVSEKAVRLCGAMGVMYTPRHAVSVYTTPSVNTANSPTLPSRAPHPWSCHFIEIAMWEPGMANSELRMWHQEV